MDISKLETYRKIDCEHSLRNDNYSEPFMIIIASHAAEPQVASPHIAFS